MFSALKPKGIGVLGGFAITREAYWHLFKEPDLRATLENVFSRLDPENLEQLAAKGREAGLQSCNRRCRSRPSTSLGGM